MDKDFYSFVKLTDLHLNLTFRISSLEGKIQRISRTELVQKPQARHWGAQKSQYPDLYVVCRLYSDNKPLTVPIKTSYKPFKNNHQWTEWITLPFKLCDLPLNAQLAFTVYDVAGSNKVNVVGGTTFSLFSKKGTLKTAQHRLFLWKGVAGDGSVEPSTPSKVGSMNDEMGRLEKLIKRHEKGDLPRIDWLDKLAYRQIEKIHKAESEASDDLFLYIDMPRFDLPIAFCEQETLLAPPNSASSSANHYPSGTLTTAAPPTLAAGTAPSITSTTATSDTNTIEANMFTIFDPEINRENPVEAKHRRLVRSHRSGPLDRELKPNAAVRDELNEILSYPPTRILTPAEMDRIWSFRFYLTRDPKGLTKFLKSVVWTDAGEAKQATEVLLPMWSEPALDDALELLGTSFRDPRVRAYAVRQLERAGDDELILYLLQLVQALKFEAKASHSGQAALSGSDGSMSTSSRDRDRERRRLLASRHFTSQATPSSSVSEDSGLAEFLIRRGLKNPVLGNNLYWYLVIECDDAKTGKLFQAVKQKYLDRMASMENGAKLKEKFDRQAELLITLSQKAKELRSSRDPRLKKIDKLRTLIADPKNGLVKFDLPIPLPLDAEILVSGIVAEKCTVFKSNLFPLQLHFTTVESKPSSDATEEEGGELECNSSVADLGDDAAAITSGRETGPEEKPSEYALIFKNGDDLRQDQLVIQLFMLMDRLLRNENLDLKITPYKVLATGAIDGMVQFVESKSIAGIMSEYGGSLLNYLRHYHPDPSSMSTFGIKPAILETFVRSCAGYCVVTYLLGVGDRHLDNLLLSPDGHFFHVDFGYILGRDPKPFPPPVKVCKEMVDAMGGTSSAHYNRFKNLCYTAFTNLRKSANLILNLIALMVDANIPDIKVEPDKAVLKVQDKFLLHLSEDEAIKEFEALLNETSYLSTMFDRLHDMAQYFRQ